MSTRLHPILGVVVCALDAVVTGAVQAGQMARDRRNRRAPIWARWLTFDGKNLQIAQIRWQ